jgi:hypothetical protein
MTKTATANMAFAIAGEPSSFPAVSTGSAETLRQLKAY